MSTSVNAPELGKWLKTKNGYRRLPFRSCVFFYSPDKAGNNKIRKLFDPNCADDDWTDTAYVQVFTVDDWSESCIIYNYLWIAYVLTRVVLIRVFNTLLIQERLACNLRRKLLEVR